MKELYAYWLRSQCEHWLKDNYETLFRLHYVRTSQPEPEESAFAGLPLLSQIQLEVGPWKSLYFLFKEPGQVIQISEQVVLTQLREEGYRVMTVRHLEDFKTWLQTYLPIQIVQEAAAPVYARKSA